MKKEQREKLKDALRILWESPEEISVEDGDKIEDLIRDVLGMDGRNAAT